MSQPTTHYSPDFHQAIQNPPRSLLRDPEEVGLIHLGCVPLSLSWPIWASSSLLLYGPREHFFLLFRRRLQPFFISLQNRDPHRDLEPDQVVFRPRGELMKCGRAQTARSYIADVGTGKGSQKYRPIMLHLGRIDLSDRWNHVGDIICTFHDIALRLRGNNRGYTGGLHGKENL